jgi:transposase InsO family protein
VKSKFIGISRTDVQNFLNNDEVHQLYKPIHKLKPLPVPSRPNLYWKMDLIDMGHELKHDNLGFQYILTVIDIFSKYAWAKYLKSKHAKSVVKALKEILNNQHVPRIIQSDNGLEFKTALMRKLLNKFHIKQIFSLPYRPQSQGCIERFNDIIKRMMYAQMDRYKTKVWADILPILIENYNTVTHSSTKYTPSLLHFTDDSEIIQKAKSRLEQINE